MRPRTLKRLYSPLLMAALSLPTFSLAQQPADSEDRWYQIEVMVIERQPSAGEILLGEHWPRDLALDYPSRFQFLTDPTEELSVAEEQAEAGDQQPEAESPDAQVSEVATQDEQVNQPTPFSLLPDEQLQLDSAHQHLQRDRSYRVLFHEAWLQPLMAEEKAPGVLIFGGEQYGEHTRLEGSLTFSVSRYLHVNSDLWLTDFEAIYGQPTGEWPQLPERPSAPRTELETTSPDDTTAATASEGINSGLSELTWQEMDASDNSPFNFNAGLTREEDQSAKPGFAIKQIVTQRQRRRMRSGELHYIDHPRLSLLVLVQPYEPQEPETDGEALSQN